MPRLLILTFIISLTTSSNEQGVDNRIQRLPTCANPWTLCAILWKPF